MHCRICLGAMVGRHAGGVQGCAHRRECTKVMKEVLLPRPESSASTRELPPAQRWRSVLMAASWCSYRRPPHTYRRSINEHKP